MSINKPRLRAFQCVQTLPGQGIFLSDETGSFQLKGAIYEQLLPLLDGHSDEVSLLKMLSGFQPSVVFYALSYLEDQKLLFEGPPVLPPEQEAFWNRLGLSGKEVSSRLELRTVSLQCFTKRKDVEETLALMLQSAGITVSQESDADIVLVDDYLDSRLEAYNQTALSTKKPWLIATAGSVHNLVGPLFIPGENGCWQCLAHRIEGHRKFANFLTSHGAVSHSMQTVNPTLPAAHHVVLGTLVNQLSLYLVTGEAKAIDGRVFSCDPTTLEAESHHLTRRPQCAECGDPQWVARAQQYPLDLQSRPKSFTQDGGHRCVTPEETVARLDHHISPITGIIYSLQPSQVEGGPASSYVANHAFGLINKDLDSFRELSAGFAGGKGKTDIQAKASAICEAIERYSGVYQGDEAVVFSSMDDLGEAAIHPNDCMGFSERQYDYRDEDNAKGNPFVRVPDPFNTSQEIDWSPVWSLASGEMRYLPTAYCYFDYSRQKNAWYTWADSNGCAAGNNLEEAIFQGFLELVERDAVAIWWYNRKHVSPVDLSSFGDPFFREFESYYAQLERDIWVLDVTTDFNIPTFAAISVRADAGEEENILMGFGCHFDPHIALSRALTELNQSLKSELSKQTKGVHGYVGPVRRAQLAWQKAMTTAENPFLTPNRALPARTFSDFDYHPSNDLRDDIDRCVQIATKLGHETLVLDMTRPDTDLCVVKVFVPGLRHFWPRFGVGRLFGAPDEENQDREASLNPQPLPL